MLITCSTLMSVQCMCVTQPYATRSGSFDDLLEEIEDIAGEISTFQNDMARGERRIVRHKVCAYEAFVRQARQFPAVWVQLLLSLPCTFEYGLSRSVCRMRQVHNTHSHMTGDASAKTKWEHPLCMHM